MKKTAILVVATALAFLAGCAAPPKQIALQSEFDADEARRLLAKGNNTIKGSALMRQLNGGVVTCAGGAVSLRPATAYAHERITHLYGNAIKGVGYYRPAGIYGQVNYPETWGNVYFTDTAPEYAELGKQTTCDAQGFFEFTDVADGAFFVITGIHWQVVISQYVREWQGGALMHKVEVKGGETKKVVLSP